MAKITKWVESSRNDRLFDVAARSIEGRLDAVLHYLPLAALHADEDVEYVHQLRVWSRRSVAAIRLFRDCLPWARAGKVKKHLSAIREAANEARDLDVLILRLDSDKDNGVPGTLIDRLHKQRRKCQQPLEDVYHRLDEGEKFKRRSRKLIKRTIHRAETDKWGDAQFGPWARKNLRPYVAQLLHDGSADLTDLAALHRFRISAKKLRYTVELLAGAFPKRLSKQLYPKIETLQDRLGEINDLAVSGHRLEGLINESSSAEEEAFLTRLLQAEQARLARKHQRFVKWWTPQRSERLEQAFSELLKRRASAS